MSLSSFNITYLSLNFQHLLVMIFWGGRQMEHDPAPNIGINIEEKTGRK